MTVISINKIPKFRQPNALPLPPAACVERNECLPRLALCRPVDNSPSMDGILKLYSLPGKLIAELWYLWPKKGQIWASGRRREHGFVHFMYSTVFYLVIAFFWMAGSSSERKTEVAVDPQVSSVYSNENEISQEDYQSYTEPTPVESSVDEPEAVVPDEVAEPAIIFESNPVVQDIPATEQAPSEETDGVE